MWWWICSLPQSKCLLVRKSVHCSSLLGSMCLSYETQGHGPKMRVEGKKSLVGLDHKKKRPLRIYSQSCPLQPSIQASFSCQKLCHLLGRQASSCVLCLDPSCPTFPPLHTHHHFDLLAPPFPFCSPTQVKSQGQVVCVAFLGMSMKRGW